MNANKGAAEESCKRFRRSIATHPSRKVGKPCQERTVGLARVFVSHLISGGKALHQILQSNTVELLICKALMEEFYVVARRPKLSRYFTSAELLRFVQLLELRAIWVTVSSEVSICRAPKDNFLLAMAQDGEADFLVTGDKDLLVLERFGQTEIITLASFRTNVLGV